MFLLTLSERIQLAKFIVKVAKDRVSVIASGHIFDGFDEQVVELNAISETGVEAVVLISNRIKGEDETSYLKNFGKLMSIEDRRNLMNEMVVKAALDISHKMGFLMNKLYF